MWFSSVSRLRRLEERIEKLEADLRTANLDWDELYQKCRKLLGRTVKEREKVERESPEILSSEPQALTSVSTLSPRQFELNQMILNRRARKPSAASDGRG